MMRGASVVGPTLGGLNEPPVGERRVATVPPRRPTRDLRGACVRGAARAWKPIWGDTLGADRAAVAVL